MYMYVYVYICIYVCMYVYIYIGLYKIPYICVCECLKAKNVFLKEIFRGGNILTPKTFFPIFSLVKSNLI